MSEKVNFMSESDAGLVLLNLMCEGARLRGCEHDLQQAFNLPDLLTTEVDVRLTVNGVEIPFTDYIEEIFSRFDGFVAEEAEKRVDKFFSEAGLDGLKSKMEEISRGLEDLNVSVTKEYSNWAGKK